MFKTILALSIVFSGSVFAQNMADNEKNEDAYMDLEDGSSRYIGKCSTHEDYEKFYFKTKKVLQRYIEPSELTDEQINAILAKFDKSVMKQVLTTFNMYRLEQGSTDFSIFKDDIDDFTVENLSHKIRPKLDLVRFRVGVGGGNGGYIVFNKVKAGMATNYEVMSYTFDGDLNYCDKKVWIEKSK